MKVASGLAIYALYWSGVALRAVSQDKYSLPDTGLTLKRQLA